MNFFLNSEFFASALRPCRQRSLFSCALCFALGAFLLSLGCTSHGAEGGDDKAAPASEVETSLNPPLPQKGSVEIFRKGGGEAIRVEVEIASNDRDRARGLMYRRSLPQMSGMLFAFKSEEVLSFWMENTFIPLDMLFIRRDGTIAGIVENASPLTRTSRRIDSPTSFVLEVNGGFCASHGIAAGDRVKIFGMYELR